MGHRHGHSGLLRCTVLLGLMCSLALTGCANNSDTPARVNGAVNLSASNVAALGGLTFAFSNATLFGFPNESANLTWGNGGTTFTLTTSGGTAIDGSITFGSCRFTQNPAPPGVGVAPLVAEYDTCQVLGSSGDTVFGASVPGTITLRLGRGSATPVDSAQTNVIYTLSTRVGISLSTPIRRP